MKIFKSPKTAIRALIALIFTSVSIAMNAQSVVNLRGNVVDEAGEPLPGVSLLIKGTSIGAATDIDGNFSINVPAPIAGKVLTVAYVGYAPQSLTLKSDQPLSIVMKEDSQNLNEVVVVGYGTQKKVNLTGSVSSISESQLADLPITSTSQAIAGLVTGASVISNSGRPGAGASIKIRGTGTFSSAGNSPLILIDGLAAGSIDDIDPSDIKSISFLKDAASASIYGNRAANGVILVETKRGSKGKASVSYSANFGWQTASELPEFLESADYATYYNMAMENMGRQPAYSADQIQKFRDGSDPDNYPNVNHLKWLLNTGSGFQQQHNVGVSGGTERTTYHASIGYRKQAGLTAKTYNERMTATLSLQTKLSDKVSLDLNINGYHNRYDAPQGSGSIDAIIGYAVREGPIFAGQKSDGSFGYQDDYSPEAWLNSLCFVKNESNNFYGSALLTWDTPLNGLSVKGKMGGQFYTYYNKSYMAETYFDETKTKGPQSLNIESGNTTYTDLEAYLNYVNSFGRHEVNILAGTSVEQSANKGLNGSRKTFPNNYLYELVSGDPMSAANNSWLGEYALASFFGRVNYNFDERYLLEANIRYDGSSRFSSKKRWGVFPSVSAGWRVSNEKFFEESVLSQYISNLKIRASHGVLGNQNIGNYPYQNTIWFGYNNPFGNPAVLVPGAVSGPYNDEMITWEKTRITDIGLDLSMFSNRLNVTFDYFYKHTSDILSSVEVASIIGTGVGNSNVGAVDNKGIEIKIDWHGNIGNDFKYSISPNFTYVKNSVKQLSDGATMQINSGRIVGEPLGIIWGYRTEGLFVDQNEIDNAPAQIVDKSSLKPGYIRYADISGPDGVPDGKVDAEYDRTILGSTTPKFYYGLSLAASYKGFDLSALFQGVGGHKRLIGSYMAYAFYNGGQIQKWQAENAFRPDAPDKYAEYPLLETLNMNHPNLQTSDYWVRDASFLRMKNLTVGYTLPSLITRKLGCQSVRLYVSGQNLFNITKFYKGWDPENEIGTGDAPSYYPINRIWSFGINVHI